MPPGPPPFAFDYLRFAKREMPGARFPLCLSGVPAAPPETFAGLDAGRLAAGDVGALAAQWSEAVGARYGVPADHVLAAPGTSGAVFLLLAALRHATRNAPVAVETPAYGVFEANAGLLGLSVVPVPRREERRFALDLDAVGRAFRDGARVLCLTDLHNPSGVALRDGDVDALRDLARRHDAWVLLDEVYRDFRDGPVGTAYRPGERLVCCASLTKCYGLGPLRAGWVLAPPEILDPAESAAEVGWGVAVAPGLGLALRGLEHADALLARGRELAAAARPVVDRWVEETPGVSWTAPDAGLTGFLRVEGLRDSVRLAAALREELGVQVVAGRHFGSDAHLRISFGLPPVELAAALDVLAMGLPPLLAG